MTFAPSYPAPAHRKPEQKGWKVGWGFRRGCSGPTPKVEEGPEEAMTVSLRTWGSRGF